MGELPVINWEPIDTYIEQAKDFLITAIPLLNSSYNKDFLGSYHHPVKRLQEAREFQRFLVKKDEELIKEPGIFDKLELRIAELRLSIPAKEKELQLFKSLKEKMDENEKILFTDKSSLSAADFAKVANNFSSILNTMDYELGSFEIISQHRRKNVHPIKLLYEHRDFLESLYRNWNRSFYVRNKESIKWGIATYCMIDAQGSILPRIANSNDAETIKLIYNEIPEKLTDCILKDMTPVIKKYMDYGQLRDKACTIHLMKNRVSKEKFGNYLKTLGILVNYSW